VTYIWQVRLVALSRLRWRWSSSHQHVHVSPGSLGAPAWLLWKARLRVSFAPIAFPARVMVWN